MTQPSDAGRPEPSDETTSQPPESAATDPSAAPGATSPSAEQIAERARRADHATRGALAGVLGLEAVVTLLVPRALAYTENGLGVTRTVLLLSLAVLMLVAAGLVRRPFGIGTGSALQMLFFLTGVLIIPMFVIGAIFAAIWGRLLWLRHELVGTPGWPAMIYS